MPDSPNERTFKMYIARGGADSALAADARVLSEMLGVGLDEVLAAVEKLGPWEPTVKMAGQAGLTIGGPVFAAVDALSVVRETDVDELKAEVARGGWASRLSANQRILAAVILLAAIYPFLPPAAQKVLLEDATLAAALGTVLLLLKKG